MPRMGRRGTHPLRIFPKNYKNWISALNLYLAVKS